MDLGIGLEQQQSMTLSPKMRQSVEILQMNSLDLNAYIQEASLENPLMDLVDYEPEEDAAATRLRKLEWLDSMDESNTFRQPISHEEEAQHPLSQKNRSENLSDDLYLQAAGLQLDEQTEKILHYLIDNLDDNGYLQETQEQLMARFPACPDKLQTALGHLRRMEPAGIGARDLQDCLQLQIERMEHPNPVLRMIVDGHLELLARNQLSALAKKLRVSLEQVKDAREQLLQLNPKPGNGYSAYSAVPYIRPDVFVVHFEDSLHIILNDFNQPRIGINSFYLNLAKETEEAKEYVVKKRQQAEWLVNCIEQRKRTIMRCSEAILKRQQDFFRLGPAHLVPLTLSDVASMISVHPSTVSRAISNKYLQCQWGIFQMNSFFTREINSGSEGASQQKALDSIQAIVQGEDTAKPLSDQDIAGRLQTEGIVISRRTVAKYRDILGIPASSRRRIY